MHLVAEGLGVSALSANIFTITMLDRHWAGGGLVKGIHLLG